MTVLNVSGSEDLFYNLRYLNFFSLPKKINKPDEIRQHACQQQIGIYYFDLCCRSYHIVGLVAGPWFASYLVCKFYAFRFVIIFGIFIIYDIGSIPGYEAQRRCRNDNPAYPVAEFDTKGWGNAADGCIGNLDDIFFWLIAGILAAILIWILGNILWALILVFMGMLYWIFFRALRMIFKRSPYCRGYLNRSIIIGLLYTLLYNSWIYGIILSVHYLIH